MNNLDPYEALATAFEQERAELIKARDDIRAALRTRSVLIEVGAERSRQDDKWGEQNHPDGTGMIFESAANHHRQLCDEYAAEGTVTFADILLEEVYEALAESEPEKLRTELLQVAAVAVSWVEALDRRKARYERGEADQAEPSFEITEVDPA